MEILNRKNNVKKKMKIEKLVRNHNAENKNLINMDRF